MFIHMFSAEFNVLGPLLGASNSVELISLAYVTEVICQFPGLIVAGGAVVTTVRCRPTVLSGCGGPSDDVAWISSATEPERTIDALLNSHNHQHHHHRHHRCRRTVAVSGP